MGIDTLRLGTGTRRVAKISSSTSYYRGFFKPSLVLSMLFRELANRNEDVLGNHLLMGVRLFESRPR